MKYVILEKILWFISYLYMVYFYQGYIFFKDNYRYFVKTKKKKNKKRNSQTKSYVIKKIKKKIKYIFSKKYNFLFGYNISI